MKIINHIVQIFISVLTGMAVILFILYMGASVIGYKPYVVTSGSMIPKYQVGSLIYVHEENFNNLHINDDITFYLSNQSVATHRIHEINYDNKTVRTYGINNKDQDGQYIIDGVVTEADDIIGKVVFSIPYIGYIYRFIDTSFGKIFFVVFIVMMMGLSYFSQNILQNREEK